MSYSAASSNPFNDASYSTPRTYPSSSSGSRFFPHDDQSASMNIEICATLLTDKPPILPLREELPSLGFEIIYNGSGVGSKTVQKESKKALHKYRKRTKVQEMQQRRLFPRSKSRIEQVLAEQKKHELELRMPHAFSYESYHHQLYHDDEDGLTVSSCTTSSSSSQNKVPGLRVLGRRRKKRSKKWHGMDFFRKAKSADDSMLGSKMGDTPLSQGGGQSVKDILGEAAFSDFLAPMADDDDDDDMDPRLRLLKQRIGSGKETMAGSTIVSGGTASLTNGPFDSSPANSSSNVMNLEIKVTKAPLSPQSGYHSTALDTVDESEDGRILDEKVRQSFSHILNNDSSSGMHLPSTFPRNTTQHQFVDTSIESSSPAALFQLAMIQGLRDKNVIQEGPDGNLTPAKVESNAVEKVQSGESNYWTSSATDVFKNVTYGVFDALGIKYKTEEEDKIPMSVLRQEPRGPVTSLLDAVLLQGITSGDETKGIVRDLPNLLRANENNKRLALHDLCGYGMPDRSKQDPSSLADMLVRDLVSYKDLVNLVFSSNVDAACQKDIRGDLPVHLLARTLMEWEASWYEHVYEQASKESNPTGKTTTAISLLYQKMSECVEMLLKPVSERSVVCREPGSIGILLPLHMACIFTASVHTMRLIVGAYPEAAKIRCNLEGVRSFVPPNSLPLELHECLSTDCPKWEIETNEDGSSLYKWSQIAGQKIKLEDRIRRSDLLMAYNPVVEPYRFENPRIQRLEAKIHEEANQVARRERQRMTRAVELLWIWFSTFQENRDRRPTYVKSVGRVLDGLPREGVEYLASIKIASGDLVSKAASPRCAMIIKRKLYATNPPELPLWNNTQNLGSEPSDRREVSLLSRLIFNITETSFPTSFIILPYRLVRNPDGRLAMASNSSSQVAIKFGECLLQLTDPKSILYFLDVKSIKHYDQSIFEAADDESTRLQTYKKIREYEAMLLGLYGENKAYLYLIDERCGLPVLSGSEASYPIIVHEPEITVKKLLPMMLVGMILMRGDKALTVLTNILLDPSVTVFAPNWLEAANDLQKYLSAGKLRIPVDSSGSPGLESKLQDLVSRTNSRTRYRSRPKKGISEWNTELKSLQAIIEKADPRKDYCGLKSSFVKGKKHVWSIENVNYSSDFSSSSERNSVVKRMAKVEEVRKRVDSVKKPERPDKVPDLEELSQKHKALTRQHSYMYTDDKSKKSISRADTFPESLSGSSAPLGFPQPENDSSDEDGKHRIKSYTYSTYHESDASDSLDWSIVDSVEGMRESRFLTQPSNIRKHFLSRVGRKHKLLFNEFAYSDRNKSPQEEREPCESTRAIGNESTRVWQETTNQLDTSEMHFEDVRVVCLKAQLAQEAKKLSILNRKVEAIQRDKMLVSMSKKELPGIVEEPEEVYSPGFDSSLAEARKLLLRLCELEDRLLFDEIELQHFRLSTYSLDQHIEELENGESSPDKESVDDAVPVRLARAITPQRHVPRPRKESSSSGDNQSVPLTEIELLDIDDISATSGSSFFYQHPSTPTLHDLTSPFQAGKFEI